VRHSQAVVRSEATRQNFESTAASMMSGLAGMSVSGDGSTYRGASWRFDLSLGLGMAAIPAVSRGTSSIDSSAGRRTSPSETNSSIICPALSGSLEFWPIHSPYFGLAAFGEGTAGWYGLSATTSVTLSGSVGARALLGTPWIALLGEYLIGYRYANNSGSSYTDLGSSYYSSDTSAEASYGISHFAAGLRLCFSRGDGGACETGLDGWAVRERVGNDENDPAWGARVALWSTNLGAIRGDVFWDYPRVGSSSASSTGLNLWVGIVKSFNWFGSPYVTPSAPREEPSSEAGAGSGAPVTAATVAVGGSGWEAKAVSHRGEEGRFRYTCGPGGQARAVWGVGPYTDDSSVCTAAVHAGHLTFAEGGSVVIEMRRGQGGYAEGSNHGVSTQSYGEWPGSFVIVSAERAAPLDRDHDQIPDERDRCPAEPETVNQYLDDDGCPDNPDGDGDGVANDADRCPDEPEDRDGFTDADGCPDRDNDNDGLADASDRCPLDAEDHDGFDDADGCPDFDNDGDHVADVDDRCPQEAGPDRDDGCPAVFQRIEVLPEGVRLHPVWRHHRFDADDQAALDEVVEYLGFRPNRGRRFEVVAFGSGRRPSRSASRRSEREATAIRDALVAHGVDPSRLIAVGGGNGQPLSEGRSTEARRQNHRVELRPLP